MKENMKYECSKTFKRSDEQLCHGSRDENVGGIKAEDVLPLLRNPKQYPLANYPGRLARLARQFHARTFINRCAIIIIPEYMNSRR